MATIRRGSSQYVSTSASTSHSVPIPAGSQIGDWVIMAASNQGFSSTFTVPGTVLVDAGNNTMRYVVTVKQLDSSDVSAGNFTVGVPTGQQVTAVCVGYSEAAGFGAIGTIWNKGAVSLAYTNAPAVVSDGVQDVLVFSLIKHSGGSQAYSSASPATITLQTALKTGTGMPSAHVGVYTGTSADRTNTWSVASGNGVGFQIAVLSVADPVNPILAEYVSGAIAAAGATVNKSESVSIVSESGYDRLQFAGGINQVYLQWDVGYQQRHAVRMYVHLPASWADTSTDLMRALDAPAASVYTRINLSGSGSPSRIRWNRDGGVQFATTGPILATSGVYRVELQSNTVTGLIRGAIWNLGSDTPLYDSGWVDASTTPAATKFRFGTTGAAPMGLLDYSISRILISNDTTNWVGRHATDILPSSASIETVGVWNGSTIEDVELLGEWNGTSVDAVELIDSI